jgi:hypothetical protein
MVTPRPKREDEEISGMSMPLLRLPPAGSFMNGR